MTIGPTQPSAPDLLSLDLSLNQKMIVGRVDRNVTQEFILVTADKARLILREAADRMEQSNSWQAPLGILVTIGVIFPTTTFQDFGLSKDVWKSLFLMAALICLVWLVRSWWRRKKSPSVEEIVNQLRTAEPPVGAPQPPSVQTQTTT